VFRVLGTLALVAAVGCALISPCSDAGGRPRSLSCRSSLSPWCRNPSSQAPAAPASGQGGPLTRPGPQVVMMHIIGRFASRK